MSSPDDDPDAEALTWAGDEERGGHPPRRASGRSGEAGDATRLEADDARSDPADGPDDATGAPEAERRSSAGRTAVTVLFAVLYLAIVLGWVLSVQRTSSGSANLFVEVTWQFGEFLAMASGALWFGAVYTLTRESRTLVRVGWWVLGVVLLVPWPSLLVLMAEAAA